MATMDPEDLFPAKKPAFEIGGDLSSISIGELEERITLLKEEIRRLEEAVDAKNSSRSAADSVFRI